MAVIEVITYEVKSGRSEEFIELTKEVKRVLERIDVGLVSFRLMHATIAGSTSGRFTFVAEYDGMTSWGKSMEIEENDPTLKEILRRSSGPDTVATLVNRALVSEIPL
jgi:hypothetical protein